MCFARESLLFGWATSRKVNTHLVPSFLSHFRSDWRLGGWGDTQNESNKASDDESSPLCWRLSWPGGSSMLIWLRLPRLPWKHPAYAIFKLFSSNYSRRSIESSTYSVEGNHKCARFIATPPTFLISNVAISSRVRRLFDELQLMSSLCSAPSLELQM